MSRQRILKLSNFSLLIVSVAAIAWFFTLRPAFLGGPAAYVTVHGISMQPTYESGDLVILKKESRYAIGDVIAFHVPAGEPGAGSIIIHRVTGLDERGYITKGDNRSGEDLWRPRGSDVLGSASIHVGGAGTWLAKLKNPLPLGLLAGGFAAFMVLTAGTGKKPTSSAATHAGDRWADDLSGPSDARAWHPVDAQTEPSKRPLPMALGLAAFALMGAFSSVLLKKTRT